METTLHLMFIPTHPDDESLRIGTTLAKYVRESGKIYRVTVPSPEEESDLLAGYR